MRNATVAMTMCALFAATLHSEPQRKRPPQVMLKVIVTAYCVEGETDSGRPTRRGVAAADPNVLPIGTVVRVNGLRGGYDGTFIVADTGRAVKANELDIFIPDCKAAKRFGRQNARLRVVRRGKE